MQECHGLGLGLGIRASQFIYHLKTTLFTYSYLNGINIQHYWTKLIIKQKFLLCFVFKQQFKKQQLIYKNRCFSLNS